MASIIIEGLTIASLAGIGIKLIFPEETVKLLRRTVFRGKEFARAGNSSRWGSPEEMAADPLFLERFLDIVSASIAENRSLLHVGYHESVDIPFDHDTPVGWVNALPRELVNGAKVHIAKLSQTASAMVVALGDLAHPAPLTNLLHMQLGYKLDFKCQSEIAIRVLDMGIGPDLGPLEGDLKGPILVSGELTPRKMIFFLPEHAGGTDIIPLEP